MALRMWKFTLRSVISRMAATSAAVLPSAVQCNVRRSTSLRRVAASGSTFSAISVLMLVCARWLSQIISGSLAASSSSVMGIARRTRLKVPKMPV